MTDFTEGSRMRTNAGSPKTEKPNIIPKGQMTNPNKTIKDADQYTKITSTYLIDDEIVIINGVQYQRVEPPKPQTLYDIIYEWKYNTYDPTCEKLVDRIGDWMSQYKCDYVVCDEYLQGYNALMKTLKGNLK
jgi:hypothetical protein